MNIIEMLDAGQVRKATKLLELGYPPKMDLALYIEEYGNQMPPYVEPFPARANIQCATDDALIEIRTRTVNNAGAPVPNHAVVLFNNGTQGIDLEVLIDAIRAFLRNNTTYISPRKLRRIAERLTDAG